MRCSHVICPPHCKLSCKNGVLFHNEKFTFLSERESAKNIICFYFRLCSWRSHGSCRSCLSIRQKRCSIWHSIVVRWQKYNIVLKKENNNDINNLPMHQVEWSETCYKTRMSGSITIKKFLLVYFVAACASCCLIPFFCVSFLLLIIVVSTLQFWWFLLWNIQLH